MTSKRHEDNIWQKKSITLGWAISEEKLMANFGKQRLRGSNF